MSNTDARRTPDARYSTGTLICIAVVLISAALGVHAAERQSPMIAIIIDDLGNRSQLDRAAIDLPGQLAYAILPHSPAALDLANAANAAGKEVLLHLPMEAENNNHLLGPGALEAGMQHDQFKAVLTRALKAIPHLMGVNNHMGSLLTQDPQRMGWLMQELHAIGGLIYVDSRTTSRTVAARAALEVGLQYLSRDVFLDNRRDSSYIHRQLDRLIAHAHKHGAAIGIGHPHPTTIAVLQHRLQRLESVRLVPLAHMIERLRLGDSNPTRLVAGKKSRDGGAYTGGAEQPYAERKRSQAGTRFTVDPE